MGCILSIVQGATTKVVELYLSGLDCPRALTCWLLFSNNEHKQLVELEINPDHFLDPKDFRDAYLATKFLSKATFLSTNIDKKAVALEKFREAELACKSINQRGYHHLTIKREIGGLLHNAIIRKIDSVLGEFDFESWVDSSDWGPGSSLLIKGVDTSPVNKYRLENGTTRPLDDLMGELYALIYPNWDLSKRQIQTGNKVITVPKNSKTDRTIAIEPGLNLWFQKGIGTLIRRRLRWVGIDLNSQEINQRLSRVGSLNNSLATVDFSAASDTIARSTVEELLPKQWFLVMDALRSRYGVLDKKAFWYEKFSSMGNGFTFELESLIFYSIAYAACKYLHYDTKDVSVYGDDVILPRLAYPLFTKACKFYGFTVNEKKSFSSGHFRESCGAHWFSGLNCKPFFLEEEVIGDSKTYLTANNVRRVSRIQGLEFCDRRFYRCWLYLRKKIRKPFLISEGYGDGGFIVNFDEATPSRARNGIEGYYTKFLADIPRVYLSDDHPVLLARLRGCGQEISFGNKTNLRRLVKQKVKRLLVRRWINLGPWI
jgi:hypothetical protein